MKHVEVFDVLKPLVLDIADKRFRHAAAVVYRSKILAFGCAEKKSHPFQSQFSKNEDAIFWHAETNAIHNALKKVEPEILSKCSLYVCRVRFKNTSDGNLMYGLSKPCKGCQECIAHYRIPTVVYTQNSSFDTDRFTEKNIHK